MTDSLAKIAITVIDAIIEEGGIDAIKAVLLGHPVTAGMIITAERAAGSAVVDAIEDERFPPTKK